ncbi:MAG TPA: hypothetical protein VD813_12055, partial [Pseudonocardia sp.]|nr:hypothetical protein [Pseudonocardia sp.]
WRDNRLRRRDLDTTTLYRDTDGTPRVARRARFRVADAAVVALTPEQAREIGLTLPDGEPTHGGWYLPPADPADRDPLAPIAPRFPGWTTVQVHLTEGGRVQAPNDAAGIDARHLLRVVESAPMAKGSPVVLLPTGANAGLAPQLADAVAAEGGRPVVSTEGQAVPTLDGRLVARSPDGTARSWTWHHPDGTRVELGEDLVAAMKERLVTADRPNGWKPFLLGHTRANEAPIPTSSGWLLAPNLQQAELVDAATALPAFAGATIVVAPASADGTSIAVGSYRTAQPAAPAAPAAPSTEIIPADGARPGRAGDGMVDGTVFGRLVPELLALSAAQPGQLVVLATDLSGDRDHRFARDAVAASGTRLLVASGGYTIGPDGRVLARPHVTPSGRLAPAGQWLLFTPGENDPAPLGGDLAAALAGLGHPVAAAPVAAAPGVAAPPAAPDAGTPAEVEAARRDLAEGTPPQTLRPAGPAASEGPRPALETPRPGQQLFVPADASAESARFLRRTPAARDWSVLVGGSADGRLLTDAGPLDAAGIAARIAGGGAAPGMPIALVAPRMRDTAVELARITGSVVVATPGDVVVGPDGAVRTTIEGPDGASSRTTFRAYRPDGRTTVLHTGLAESVTELDGTVVPALPADLVEARPVRPLEAAWNRVTDTQRDVLAARGLVPVVPPSGEGLLDAVTITALNGHRDTSTADTAAGYREAVAALVHSPSGSPGRQALRESFAGARTSDWVDVGEVLDALSRPGALTRTVREQMPAVLAEVLHRPVVLVTESGEVVEARPVPPGTATPDTTAGSVTAATPDATAGSVAAASPDAVAGSATAAGPDTTAPVVVVERDGAYLGTRAADQPAGTLPVQAGRTPDPAGPAALVPLPASVSRVSVPHRMLRRILGPVGAAAAAAGRVVQQVWHRGTDSVVLSDTYAALRDMRIEWVRQRERVRSRDQRLSAAELRARIEARDTMPEPGNVLGREAGRGEARRADRDHVHLARLERKEFALQERLQKIDHSRAKVDLRRR